MLVCLNASLFTFFKNYIAQKPFMSEHFKVWHLLASSCSVTGFNTSIICFYVLVSFIFFVAKILQFIETETGNARLPKRRVVYIS